jgi:hypothetical protein
MLDMRLRSSLSIADPETDTQATTTHATANNDRRSLTALIDEFPLKLLKTPLATSQTSGRTVQIRYAQRIRRVSNDHHE